MDKMNKTTQILIKIKYNLKQMMLINGKNYKT